MIYLTIIVSILIIVLIYALGNTKIKKLEEKLYYEKKRYYELYKKQRKVY